jgi:hypothetical protein
MLLVVLGNLPCKVLLLLGESIVLEHVEPEEVDGRRVERVQVFGNVEAGRMRHDASGNDRR